MIVQIGIFLLLMVVFVLYGKFNSGSELFPDIEPRLAYVSIDAPSGTRAR